MAENRYTNAGFPVPEEWTACKTFTLMGWSGTMIDDIKEQHAKAEELFERMLKRIRVCEKERRRLFTLAVKHCPSDHHDFKELLELAEEYR